MTFLYPQFLIGLAALAIPVVIHLFDFRKTKKVYFSNTRFLHQVKESASSLYRLKHLLILTTRLLFILFLVLAFAQPFIPASNGDGLVANKVGIYLDNSYSMSNEVASELSGLDLAKQIAGKIVDLYPSETEFKVLSTGQLTAPRQLKSRQETLKFIADLRYTDSYKTIEQLLSLMDNKGESLKEVYLITDFQKSTSGPKISEGDSTINSFLIPIRFEQLKNVFIDSLFIDNPFVLHNDKVELKVRLRNISSTPIENLPIKLFLNDRQISATTIAIGGQDMIEVAFDMGYNLANFNNGVIKIEDYPVSFDNDFFFTLNYGNKINILEIADADAGKFIKEVYGNDNLFDLKTQQPGNIDYALLRTSDLIVVNQLNVLPEELSQRLLSFHATGGLLLIIPDRAPVVSSYYDLMPGIRSVDSKNYVRLINPDFSRPFFNNIVIGEDQDISMPQAKAVWNWGADRSAYLKFQDGQPFLSELEANKFVLAAPLMDDFSDFQLHALFVPVMYRVAAKSGFKDQPLFYRSTQSELSFRIDSLQHNELLDIEGESGVFIPDQRVSGRIVQVSVATGMLPAGQYELKRNGQTKYSFAINNDKKESELLQLADNELIDKFSGLNSEIYSSTDADAVVEDIITKYKGISLWRYTLTLSLLFLFLEVLFIRLL